jgi:hypothetical protein
MPIQKITSGILQDGAIATADIADGSITDYQAYMAAQQV